MFLMKKVTNLILNHQKCVRPYLRTVLFIQHQHCGAASKMPKIIIVETFRQKLNCCEKIAENIYTEYPSLRNIDAIKDDVLQFLHSHFSKKSIYENPFVLTMNVDILKKKVNLLNSIHPKSLDDFAPLLALKESWLKKLIDGLKKDTHNNRIYYLSQSLQVEPKVISKSLSKSDYSDITNTTLKIFEKKINILMDYGVNPLELANHVNVLISDTETLLRRCESALAIGTLLKPSQFLLSQEFFNELIQKSKLEGAECVLSTETLTRIKKRNTDKEKIVTTLKFLLNANDFEASKLYYSHVNEIDELKMAEKNITHLLNTQIKCEEIRKNGFLLTMPIDEIESKLKIVKEMKPKAIADFIPLVNTDYTELADYKQDLVKSKSIGNHHPIYYFAEKLDMPVDDVATAFAKKSTVYFKIKPDKLKSKLDVLVKHNVDCASILGSSMTFKHYSAEKIDEIIISLKKKGLDKIVSSMIHVSGSPQLEMRISRYTGEKEVLNGFENNMDYLSHRLSWTKDELKATMAKNPRLKNNSALRIKNHLDFLQNEAGFTTQDITKSISGVFNISLDEMRQRFNEIRNINDSVELSVITRSKAQYLTSIRRFCKTKFEDVNWENKFSVIEERVKRKK